MRDVFFINKLPAFHTVLISKTKTSLLKKKKRKLDHKRDGGISTELFPAQPEPVCSAGTASLFFRQVTTGEKF